MASKLEANELAAKFPINHDPAPKGVSASGSIEDLPLVVAFQSSTSADLGSAGLVNLLEGTHAELDEVLSDGVQLAILQRVETIQQTLKTMGMDLDMDTLMRLPTFVERK